MAEGLFFTLKNGAIPVSQAISTTLHGKTRDDRFAHAFHHIVEDVIKRAAEVEPAEDVEPAKMWKISGKSISIMCIKEDIPYFLNILQNGWGHLEIS